MTAAPSAPDAMQLVASHRIDRPTSAAQPADQPTQFWCPMHPDVRTEVDGVCTQCGMPLRPVGAVVPGAYDLDVHVGAPDTASGTQRLTLVARAPRTQEIATRFEKVHDRPFHLFILSEDLADYQHVHPVVGQDGALTVDARLPRGRAVELWADFLPTGGMPQLIRKTIVRHDARDQSGGATARHLTPDLAPKSIAGMRVRIGEEARRLVAGRPTLLSVALEDEATGGPVADLQPYLGAWGHAFIVSSDLTDAVHSHPVNLVSSAPGPRIQFLQRFPRPGMYRVWMQFQRRGAVATAAFTVRVDEAAASVPLFADAR